MAAFERPSRLMSLICMDTSRRIMAGASRCAGNVLLGRPEPTHRGGSLHLPRQRGLPRLRECPFLNRCFCPSYNRWLHQPAYGAPSRPSESQPAELPFVLALIPRGRGARRDRGEKGYPDLDIG